MLKLLKVETLRPSNQRPLSVFISEAEVNEEYEHLLQSEPGTPPLPDNGRTPLHSVSAKKAIEEVTQISSTNAVDSSMHETKKTLATPAVRRLAAEYKVSILRGFSYH